jgi:hypothetical protein
LPHPLSLASGASQPFQLTPWRVVVTVLALVVWALAFITLAFIALALHPFAAEWR